MEVKEPLKINVLLKEDIFSVLNNEEKDYLSKYSNIVHYNRRNTIFLQNTRTSHIMYVKEGLVKIYKEGRMGKTVILKLATPNTFIGLMSTFGSEIHEYSGAAIYPTDILYIDNNAFRSLINSNGEFASRLVKILSQNGLYVFNKLIAQTHKQLPGRIADVLLYFSETIYQTLRFELPLTRKELAELAGTTKESFIRTLTEFKNDKIIEVIDNEIEIKSIKIVKTLSELG